LLLREGREDLDGEVDPSVSGVVFEVLARLATPGDEKKGAAMNSLARHTIHNLAQKDTLCAPSPLDQSDNPNPYTSSQTSTCVINDCGRLMILLEGHAADLVVIHTVPLVPSD